MNASVRVCLFTYLQDPHFLFILVYLFYYHYDYFLWKHLKQVSSVSHWFSNLRSAGLSFFIIYIYIFWSLLRSSFHVLCDILIYYLTSTHLEIKTIRYSNPWIFSCSQYRASDVFQSLGFMDWFLDPRFMGLYFWSLQIFKSPLIPFPPTPKEIPLYSSLSTSIFHQTIE